MNRLLPFLLSASLLGVVPACQPSTPGNDPASQAATQSDQVDSSDSDSDVLETSDFVDPAIDAGMMADAFESGQTLTEERVRNTDSLIETNPSKNEAE